MRLDFAKLVQEQLKLLTGKVDRSGKAGRLRWSTQHFVEVYSQESRRRDIEAV